jgi:KaiC/GvpD/RAD55 family RecA-like ATPase
MDEPRISTGVEGLDIMLRGGLIPGRVYLVKGSPGTGKTTLGMHFSMAGITNGENVLYITLEEPAVNLRRDFSRMGFDVNNPNFTLIDATPTSERYVLIEDYFEKFAKSLDRLTESILEQYKIKRYSRIVIDPISMLKVAMSSESEYRRSFLSFVKSMLKLNATVMLISEIEKSDIEEYLVDGVIELRLVEAGDEQIRLLKITKFRGSGFDHKIRPFKLTDRGMVVILDKGSEGEQ